MRVLVVRVTSMGDVVLTLPAVSDMVANVPGVQIDWLVEKPFSAIPAMHSGVDTVIPVQWRKWRTSFHLRQTRQAWGDFRAQIQANKYDMVLDFQGQIAKSVILGWQAHGPLVGFGWNGLREPLSSLFYRRKGNVERSLHLVPRSRTLAAQLCGYELPQTAPQYGLRAPTPDWVPKGSRFAVLIPGASRVEKRWPTAHWIEVGLALRAQGFALAILWGSPSELQLAQELASACDAEVPPFLSVAQAAGLLAASSLVVGLDTGFTHLAVAFKRPTVGIYCDFDPALAGLLGSGFTASIGGVATVPSVSDIQHAVQQALLTVP
jgi:heptosyltransferase I